MVSRAGRAFPTVHTDLLLASLMPDNITTSGTRMLDITIKRGRCLTSSQKQMFAWRNFTNHPLNSPLTEDMNLTWLRIDLGADNQSSTKYILCE